MKVLSLLLLVLLCGVLLGRLSAPRRADLGSGSGEEGRTDVLEADGQPLVASAEIAMGGVESPIGRRERVGEPGNSTDWRRQVNDLEGRLDAADRRIRSLEAELSSLQAERNQLMLMASQALDAYLSADEIEALSVDGLRHGIRLVTKLDGLVTPEQVKAFAPRAARHIHEWRDLENQVSKLRAQEGEAGELDWSPERRKLEMELLKEDQEWMRDLGVILQDNALLEKLGYLVE